jgi:exodeoxyribonuclease VII large subunit
VRVQGDGAGDAVAAAIEGFNAAEPGGPIPRPDVLIVARGGGSLEDLWCFNDEAVVRAAAASSIPLISAVGHETDWTLIDHAADQRAPTPTGAAEIAVPVKADLEAEVAGLSARLKAAATRQMDNRRQALRALARALPSLDQLLALPRRRFDEAAAGLGRGLQMNTANKRRSFERISTHLRPDLIRTRIGDRRQRLSDLVNRAERIVERQIHRGEARVSAADAALRALPSRLIGQIHRAADRVAGLSARSDAAVGGELRRLKGVLAAQDRVLQSLSYRNVLRRGFALVRDAADEPVKQAAAVTPGMALSLEFADGRVSAVAGEDGAPPSPQAPKKRPTRTTDPSKQGSLF